MRRPLALMTIAAVTVGGIALTPAAAPATVDALHGPAVAQAAQLNHIGNIDFNPLSGGVVELAEMRVCVFDGSGACTADEEGNIVYENRDFAFAADVSAFGSYSGSLKVFDVTDPISPALVGRHGCHQRSEGSLDARADLGLLVAACGADRSITIFNISDPRLPTKLSSVVIPLSGLLEEVHGVTFHPTLPVVYVSTLGFSPPGSLAQIPIIDVSNPAAPRLVAPFASHVQSAHAISFNQAGTRAYAAAITHTDILDTTNPLAPTLVASIHDPSNKSHSWVRVTPDGKYLAVGDLFLTSEPCPSGAVHIYDLTVEAVPVKIGAFAIPASTTVPLTTPCANMYFDIDRATGRMALPWTSQGTFLVDVSDPRGLGSREIARSDTATTWNAISSTFYEGRIYNVDLDRGLDIFEVPAGGSDL